jgi:hypothetical protein
MQIEVSEKINLLITPVSLHPVAPGCTRNGLESDAQYLHIPFIGKFKARTPIPEGILVGGTGLEPATSSV